MSKQLKTKAKLEDGADSLDNTTKSILLSTSNLLMGPISISKGIKEDQGLNTTCILLFINTVEPLYSGHAL